MSVPAELAGTATTWTLCGEALFKWSVFDVYRVGLFARASGLSPRGAHGLVFEYLRNIDADTLVASTMQEIQRIVQPDEAAAARWQAALQTVVPAVVRASRLTVVCDPERGADFHFQGKAIGTIADGAFAEAFLAVWLDPATRAPEVRALLLGARGDVAPGPPT